MQRRTVLGRWLRDESGGSLPFVLIILGVGVLLLSPFLAGVSTRMLAARAAEDTLGAQYAGDSGIEYAIWRLGHDSAYAAAVNLAFPSPYPAPAEQITVNQLATSVQSTIVTPLGWSQVADAPGGVSQGGILAGTPNGLVYGFQGSGDAFWRYSSFSDSWASMATAPGDPKKRVGLAAVQSSSIFALPQLKDRSVDQFWRYSVGSNSWSKPPSVAEPPNNGDKGGSLAPDGVRYIYALLDAKSDNFYRYDSSTDQWSQLPDFTDPSDPSARAGDGMSLVYAGGSLYFLLGGNSDNFYRYSSGSWSSLSPAPGNVSDGGSLVYTGGDRLFALGGGGSDFWSYSLSGHDWQTLSATPFSVGSGGSLAYAGGDYLYAVQGGGSSGFWRYLVSDPIYDISATGGGSSTQVRARIGGSGSATVIWWLIQ